MELKVLSSGGITGIHVVKIIHSGLFPESIKDSINFNLFIALSSATFDLFLLAICLNFSFSAFKSKFNNNFSYCFSS